LPLRPGDVLADVGAGSDTERVAAQVALAKVRLKAFVAESVILCGIDEVSSVHLWCKRSFQDVLPPR